MSKERLELIKGKVEQLVINVDNEGNGEANLLAVANDMNYLIERVWELEKLQSDSKLHLLNVIDNYRYKNEVMEKENKRYREALEDIKAEETITTALSNGQVAYTRSGHIARKALECGE